MDRPEHTGSASLYYNEAEAEKYSNNMHIIEIQSKMTERALQLLGIHEEEEDCLILDIGCGSGISGSVLTDNGYQWVGIDLSIDMLQIARDRELDGDLIAADFGDGLPFVPGTFDYAVSVSAIQWLCTAAKKVHNPIKRLKNFFQSLFTCLVRGAKCAFQFYPENSQQIELISNAAMSTGFNVGLIIDYPNSSKAKKYYLYLVAGWSDTGNVIPQALTEYGEEEDDIKRAMMKKSIRKDKNNIKTKSWIKGKKDLQRHRGIEVKTDSKYSGRKRHK